MRLDSKINIRNGRKIHTIKQYHLLNVIKAIWKGEDKRTHISLQVSLILPELDFTLDFLIFHFFLMEIECACVR